MNAVVNLHAIDAEERAKLQQQTDLEAEVLAYFDAKAELDRLTAENKERLESIVAHCGYQPGAVLGHKLALVERKGSVDYKALLDRYLPKVNVEPFRKAGTQYWQLK